MSNSELSKTRDLRNESAQSFATTLGNAYRAVDIELINKDTVTPEPLSKVKNKDCVCIDVNEDNKEHRSDTKEDPGMFAKIPELKVHIVSPATAIQKTTIKEFYDSMVEFREQQRLAREIRHQKQSSPLPLQTVMLHDDLTKSSDTVQVPGYPPVPKSLGTENPQKEDQYLARLRGGFDDDRTTFVAVVLTITFVMLAFTVAFVAVVVLISDLKSLFKRYSIVLCISTGIILLTVNCVFVYSQCARRLPINFILLFITMTAMSVLAAATSSRFNTDLILLAVLATTIVVGVCCIIASMGFDFTSFFIYLIVISLVLSVVCLVFFGIRLATGQKMKMFHLFLLLIMTGVQCMFLIVQLQMILGGKSIELSEEDYALGAYFLYTSIVNIFLNLLSLIGEIDD